MEERVYLKKGDGAITDDDVSHTWDGKSFHLNGNGDLHFMKEEKLIPLHYAFDLNNDDPNYGKPYYRASEGSENGHRS
jgi:hypothetical protein